MKKLINILRRQDGASSIEFTLAAPVFLLMFYGVAQYGMIFLANAGLRHAVDAGARAATVYVGTTPLSDSAIQTIVNNERFGFVNGTVSTPVIARGTTNGINYVEITLSYSSTLDFVFFRHGPIVISETRRAYLP